MVLALRPSEHIFQAGLACEDAFPESHPDLDSGSCLCMLCSEIKSAESLELNCPGVMDAKMRKAALFLLDVSRAGAVF